MGFGAAVMFDFIFLSDVGETESTSSFEVRALCAVHHQHLISLSTLGEMVCAGLRGGYNY